MFKNSDLIIPRDKKGTRHEVGIGNQYSDSQEKGTKTSREAPVAITHREISAWQELRSEGMIIEGHLWSWVSPSDEAHLGPERQNLTENQRRPEWAAGGQRQPWATYTALEGLCWMVLMEILVSLLLSALAVPTTVLNLLVDFGGDLLIVSV